MTGIKGSTDFYIHNLHSLYKAQAKKFVLIKAKLSLHILVKLRQYTEDVSELFKLRIS
jgi:hypothetical protein